MRWKSLWSLLLLFQLSTWPWAALRTESQGVGPAASQPVVLTQPNFKVGDDPCVSPCLTVRIYPDGELHAGDWVSLQVLAPAGMDFSRQKLTVQITSDSDPANSSPPIVTMLRPADFVINDNQQYLANLIWAWDTHNLTPGPYRLHLSVDPNGESWEQMVQLAPPILNPPHWAKAQSQCCTFDYITGTAAERDLEKIKQTADQQAQDVSMRLKMPINGTIQVVLVPRVLGQGGFTTNLIYISYLDRNYSSDNFSLILHHEMVHYLDQQMGGDLRPIFFEEGLAVFLSGGHYTAEPLLLTAATLPEQGLYLPMPRLMDAFYSAQHETGYLEAAALTQWIIETWGWDAFARFYRDIHPDPGGSEAAAINLALQKHFHLSLHQLENQFMAVLDLQPVNPNLKNLIRLTAAYYDAVRLYQQILDPSAYFRTVWSLNVNEMIQKGIVNDYIHHPETTANQTIELLFINARHELNEGDEAGAEQSLRAINQTLKILQSQYNLGQDSSTLERQFTQSVKYIPAVSAMEGAVEALHACGAEPQAIDLEKNKGQAAVITDWPLLANINLTYQKTWSADCINNLKK